MITKLWDIIAVAQELGPRPRGRVRWEWVPGARHFQGYWDPRTLTVQLYVAPPSRFPYVNSRWGRLASREEALVALVAHELAHARQWYTGRVLLPAKQREQEADRAAIRTLTRWRQLNVA